EIKKVLVGNLGIAPAGLVDVETMRDVDGGEAVGAIAERHGSQGDAVHHREDGHVHANAKRHREKGANEERRLLGQAPPGVEKVAHRSAHAARYRKPCATKLAVSGPFTTHSSP